MLRFIDETQEYIVDLFAYEGAQSQELSIDAVQDRFQKVTFTWIFWIEQLEQLQ